MRKGKGDFWLPLTRVRVSCGHLCKAEAPTEAVAETLSSETRLKERKDKVIMYLNPFSPSVFLLTQKSTSLVRGRHSCKVF